MCPSFRPSVCLSNVWIVTKRKKDLSRFLSTMLQENSSKDTVIAVRCTCRLWQFGSTPDPAGPTAYMRSVKLLKRSRNFQITENVLQIGTSLHCTCSSLYSNCTLYCQCVKYKAQSDKLLYPCPISFTLSLSVLTTPLISLQYVISLLLST